MLTGDDLKKLTAETAALIASGKVDVSFVSPDHLARCRDLLTEEVAQGAGGLSLTLH